MDRDIFIDTDDNGVTDDPNADSGIAMSDAHVRYDIIDLQDRVRGPLFAGGLGTYKANSAHGPFVHVDVRGTTACWQEAPFPLRLPIPR